MHKDRRRTKHRVDRQYGAVGLVLALMLTVAMYKTASQQGYAAVMERAQAEAGLVVELTTGFVRTYSIYQARSGSGSLPNPARYRAEALSHVEQSARIDGQVATGVVGLPGREIARQATDEQMRSQLNELDRSPSIDMLSSIVEQQGDSTLRSLWPFIASEQSCADCHNRLQNLTGADKWKVGDLMGAQIVEKNITSQLTDARNTALLQSTLVFAAVLAIWFCCIYLINHFRLTRELTILAATDPLTGCINRREFHRRITDVAGLSNGALLMLDLDKFKQINDTFGHDAGDLVIRDFANRISSNSREDDLVARFGGEEFVIWLPDTRAIDAIRLAERLRTNVEQAEVSHNNTTIRYTVSIGLHIVQNTASSPIEKWLKAADDLVYRAKSEGRNRIAAGAESPA